MWPSLGAVCAPFDGHTRRGRYGRMGGSKRAQFAGIEESCRVTPCDPRRADPPLGACSSDGKLNAVEHRRKYEVVLSLETDAGFSVFVPELPSVATQGDTREEALTMAKEAIEGYLEVMAEDGLPIPRVERGHVAIRR